MHCSAGTCERVGAQIFSPGAAFGGLAGGFEGAGAAAQDEVGRPGPWLWQGWPRGPAAGKGGRRVNRLEGTWQKLASFCLVELPSGLPERQMRKSGIRPTARSWLGIALGVRVRDRVRVRFGVRVGVQVTARVGSAIPTPAPPPTTCCTVCCDGLVFSSPTAPSTGTRVTCMKQMFSRLTRNWSRRTGARVRARVRVRVQVRVRVRVRIGVRLGLGLGFSRTTAYLELAQRLDERHALDVSHLVRG